MSAPTNQQPRPSAFTVIRSKFLGPTNFRGSRVSASTTVYSGGPHREHVTLAWDHALDGPANHSAAAQILAQRLGWSGAWQIGDDHDEYVFVRTMPDAPAAFEILTTVEN